MGNATSEAELEEKRVKITTTKPRTTSEKLNWAVFVGLLSVIASAGVGYYLGIFAKRKPTWDR